MTIQLKAIEQYLGLLMKPLCVTIQMKFRAVLFIMQYKVVLTFTSVDDTLTIK